MAESPSGDSAASPVESSLQETGLITGDRVNLRAGPGLAFEAIRQLSKGQEVTLRRKRTGWYGVDLPKEVSAYIHQNFLKINGDVAQVTASRVHVRSGPGPTFASLGLLSKAEQVRLRKNRSGKWIEVVPPDFCLGWVSAKYLVAIPNWEMVVPDAEASVPVEEVPDGNS